MIRGRMYFRAYLETKHHLISISGGLLGLFQLLDQVGQAALAAVLTVLVVGHEHATSAVLAGALPPQPGDLSLVADLVILQGGQLDLLMLVLDLLGSGVVLLLALLATTPQAEDQVKGRFFLDVVVGQGPAILKLLAGKDQPLLVWRDTLLVLDLGLDILDGIGGLDLEGDGLAREGLDENLHLDSDENTSALSET